MSTDETNPPKEPKENKSRPPLPPRTPPFPPASAPLDTISPLGTIDGDEALPVPNLTPAIKHNGTAATAAASSSGGGHKRIVSWGALTNQLQQPILPSGSGQNSTGSSSRITQEDLAARMPTESEAESYIVNSLENRDPTGAPRSEKSILSNITDAEAEALTLNESGSAGSFRSSGRRMPGNPPLSSSKKKNNTFLKVANTVKAQTKHRRKETVGDRLQGLAAAMDAVHLQHLEFLDDDDDARLSGPPAMEVPNADQPLVGSADAFQHNTNLLFQRHASTRSGLGLTKGLSTRSGLGSGSTKGAPVSNRLRLGSTGSVAASTRSGFASTAADVEAGIPVQSVYLSTTPMDIAEGKKGAAEKRWKMLKHAVAITNAMDESKKAETPDTEPDDLPVDSGSNDKKCEDSSDNSSEGGNQTSTRRKVKKTTVFQEFQDLITPSDFSTLFFFRIGILFIMLPSAGIAAILFYFAGNPPTGIVDLDRSRVNGTLWNNDGEVIGDESASASWWLLFLGVRQVFVLMLAKCFEIFFIDVLSVRSRFSVRIFGPWATLFILQTKGWPIMLFMWGILSTGLLSGTKPFFHHWGYAQDSIDIFNEANPSGQIVNSEWNHRLTAIAVAVGVIVSAKRFWLAQFSEKLASIMKKILLISEVASLGRAFERYALTHKDDMTRRRVSVTSYGVNSERLRGMITSVPDESQCADGDEATEFVDTADAKYVIDPDDRHPMTGALSQTQKGRILTLLGQWSEPTLAEKKTDTAPTVNEILQFRRALEYLHTSFPFSGSFGLADRRETTIESAQEVYGRLLLRSPDPDTLNFDVIALLGVGRDGELDCGKLKDLIKLFRPDRDGTMECVDFVKSVDEVYKELRLLRASVANSSKIDRAFETIFNLVFYAILFCLILSQLGYDPLALFLSISGVVLAFAFMIGSASSKYFEGLLFILARRPYQIGDGIALSAVNDQTPFTGSPVWVVEGEKATVSNGSLAASRVINASISKEAQLYVMIKFPIEVSYEKLQVFREQVAIFFKNRPREWIAFTRFRSTRFEIDLGFVEYIICAQHRLDWSKYGDLQQSKADLMHFCMELQKRMDLLYKQPTQPVDVNLRNGFPGATIPGTQSGSPAPQSPFAAPSSPGGSVTMDNPKFTALQSVFAPKSDS
eukprot:scaffold42631_cov168-Amphora_coffeaeformis.AAC.1